MSVRGSARMRADLLWFVDRAGHTAVVGSSAGGTVPDELLAHLVRSTALDPGVAARVIDEVVSYFSESATTFVRRRHRELQADGLANAEIYGRIADELASRPVAAPELTERQIRRLVYGG